MARKIWKQVFDQTPKSYDPPKTEEQIQKEEKWQEEYIYTFKRLVLDLTSDNHDVLLYTLLLRDDPGNLKCDIGLNDAFDQRDDRIQRIFEWLICDDIPIPEELLVQELEVRF